MTSTPFVSTQWLADHLVDPDVTIIDASWYLPTQNRNGRTEYEAGHIPGAVFFDIDEISDKTSSLPHMLPDAAQFAQHMARLGISDQAHLIVYDGAGLFSAPRVRWTLQVFGATNVSILAGGAPKWRSENRPWTNAATTPKSATFTPTFNAASVATLATVKNTLKTGSAQIVDARPADRFRGDAPEPRPGLKSGHMPGSFNVPGLSLSACVTAESAILNPPINAVCRCRAALPSTSNTAPYRNRTRKTPATRKYKPQTACPPPARPDLRDWPESF